MNTSAVAAAAMADGSSLASSATPDRAVDGAVVRAVLVDLAILRLMVGGREFGGGQAGFAAAGQGHPFGPADGVHPATPDGFGFPLLQFAGELVVGWDQRRDCVQAEDGVGYGFGFEHVLPETHGDVVGAKGVVDVVVVRVVGGKRVQAEIAADFGALLQRGELFAIGFFAMGGVFHPLVEAGLDDFIEIPSGGGGFLAFEGQPLAGVFGATQPGDGSAELEEEFGFGGRVGGGLGFFRGQGESSGEEEAKVMAEIGRNIVGVFDDLLGAVEELTVGEPVGVTTGIPFGEVLFGDGAPGEVGGEPGADFGEGVEPGEDGGLRFAVEQAFVEGLPDFSGQAGDFSAGTCVHGDGYSTGVSKTYSYGRNLGGIFGGERKISPRKSKTAKGKSWKSFELLRWDDFVSSKLSKLWYSA